MSGFRVPRIDLGGLAAGDRAAITRIAAEVDRAAREVGFLQVIGHGIPESAITALGAAIDAFFALPAAHKQQCLPAAPEINRGYSGPLSEKLSHSLGIDSAADLFEAFNIGTAASAFPALALPASAYPENLWPAGLPGFRTAVLDWFAQAAALARRLTRVFACALGLPDDYFAPFQTHSIDTLRLNHYRPPPEGLRLAPGQMGMGAHTDYGIVTILWADAVQPGLQVLDADGGWQDVQPAPGALLVNLGDLLARWSNDRWRSTLHRVLPPVTATGQPLRRRSAAFFNDGNHDAVIQCLPGCADAANPARHAPVTVGAHLAAKLRGSRGLSLNPDAGADAERLLRALS